MKTTFFALLTALAAAVSSVDAATYVTARQQSAPFQTVYVNIDSATVLAIRQSGGNFIVYAITADSGVYDLLPFFDTWQDAFDAINSTNNTVVVPVGGSV